MFSFGLRKSRFQVCCSAPALAWCFQSLLELLLKVVPNKVVPNICLRFVPPGEHQTQPPPRTTRRHTDTHRHTHSDWRYCLLSPDLLMWIIHLKITASLMRTGMNTVNVSLSLHQVLNSELSWQLINERWTARTYYDPLTREESKMCNLSQSWNMWCFVSRVSHFKCSFKVGFYQKYLILFKLHLKLIFPTIVQYY